MISLSDSANNFQKMKIEYRISKRWIWIIEHITLAVVLLVVLIQ